MSPPARNARRRSTSSAARRSPCWSWATASCARRCSLIRSGRLGGAAGAGASAAPPGSADTSIWPRARSATGQTLLGDGSVRRLRLTVGEVNEAFARPASAGGRTPETGDPDDTLHRPLRRAGQRPGDRPQPARRARLRALRRRLKPGQQAILVAGDGAYSFKGSGYVRGGIFDRIELIQDAQASASATATIRGSATSPPTARRSCARSRCSSCPRTSASISTEPWQLQLLVQRSVGARDKAFLTFDLGYTLPEPVSDATSSRAARRQRRRAAQPARRRLPVRGAGKRPTARSLDDEPLWQRIWQTNTVSIAITVLALLVLTGIFFFQDWLVRRPRALPWVRRGYPAVHAGLARLVRQGAALGGQRPDLHQRADHRLQLGLLPAGAAGLHPVVRGGGRRCCSGAAGRSAAGCARSARCRS